MANKKVLTRNKNITVELERKVIKVFKGVEFEYKEVYYLDHEVNEETGLINKENLIEHFTKEQVKCNIKALNNSYMIAKEL